MTLIALKARTGIAALAFAAVMTPLPDPTARLLTFDLTRVLLKGRKT
jgi:hypothetical protein